MNEFSKEMSKRLLDFATAGVKLSMKLSRTATGRVLGNQLLRSCSSSGANYREACGAESRADFIHKIQITLKELRETEYWLELIANVGLLPRPKLEPLLREADELIRVFVRSVVTSKSGPK